MKPFTYVLPHTLAEAHTAAKKAGVVLKGAGIDLVDRLKERIEAPPEVVNLLALKNDLAGIADDGDGLRIGALTTLRQIAEAAALQGPAFGAVRVAAGLTATPLVRNRATLGGNLLQLARCWYLRSAAFGCLHGGKGPTCLAMTGENRYHSILGWHDCVRVHPSNLAPALLACGAEYTTFFDGKQERRPLAALFPDEPTAQKAEHTLREGEILVAIHLPKPSGDVRSTYQETREKDSFDWATTAAAVQVTMQDGTITQASIVLGAVSPVPRPRPEAAKSLVGKKPGDAAFLKAAEMAVAGASPLSQNAYKLSLCKAIVRAALTEVTR